MSDFDLSQALTGSPTSDEVGCETCSNVSPTQNEHFRLKEGLDLVATHNPVTLERVAKLVLVLKKSSKTEVHQPSNDELYCMNMDSLVEETVVRTTEYSCTGVSRDWFQRVNGVSQFTLCDISQKDVVHGSGEIKMQAITLKGGHSERKVKFEQSRYIHNFASAGDVQSVALTIINTNIHISCSVKDGKPVLNMEECSKEHLKTISNDGNLERFLFYKRTTGISMTTFESVMFRGWFISTSCESENEPLEMCEADAARRVTCFKLNEKHC